MREGLLLWVGWCVCEAASITVTPDGGVTDEGDAIGAETAEQDATQRTGRADGGGGQAARPAERNDKDGTSALKVDAVAEAEKGPLCGWRRPEESLLCGDKL